ncbi:MAG: GntR family transcriptional regulator [Firmicutes bacterium HGW-Firmicutes-9]|nr:MAG: GntR family transcriptional regulator [Firmicutes bacterium HGW-Firmicutes-9]
MAWQFNSNRPIYQQIVDEIELRILNGTYEMGMRLPSVRDLAVLAAVNPNTMQRALAELEEMGLVTTQRNTGRTVTTDETAVSRARDIKADLLAETFMMQMQALGLSRKEVLERLTKAEHKEGEHAVNS